MKVGIITFHWGTNYGAVLQSFALQKFLEMMGFDVQIINYAPFTHRDSFFYCIKTKNPKVAYNNVKEYYKEKNFIPFRKKYLNMTQRYYSLKELQKNAPPMDVYITGSDQVWNPYIAKNYGVPYFLGFGAQNIKRIAYAVSFGCTDYPEEIFEELFPFIKRFDALSVRENTGLNILNKRGIKNVKLMPDPTLLLCESDFDALIKTNKNSYNHCFFYILQKHQKVISELYGFTKKELKFHSYNTKDFNHSFIGIEDWVTQIKSSDFVVTNSFHGIVFSIIFKKQFVAVPIEGKLEGMNDRIYTLLKQFNLQDRILSVYDEKKFVDILNKSIEWSLILDKLDRLKKSAHSFLIDSIEYA